MTIDHVALLPAYLAAATAVAAFLADLLTTRRVVVAGAVALGAVATAVAAFLVGRGPTRRTFCIAADCSYVANHRAALVAALFAGLTLAVVALSVPSQRLGEYYFLLGCAMTGGVVLGYAGDLITLIVALETLTLPLYILVALGRGTADAAVTFFVVSVVSTAVALLGAALLYAATGALHFGRLAAALGSDPEAYRYLPRSIEAFYDPEALAGLLQNAGFRRVRFEHLTFGVAAIHVGEA